MKFIDKFKEKWKKKKTKSKVSDILFWIFIIALIVPQSRAAIMGQVNTLKSYVFKPEVIKSEQVKELKDPDYIWKFTKADDSQIYLSDLKGKVIFINKWATWCPPCVAEMPSIQKLYERYKDNPDVEFVIVSGESTKKINDFAIKKEFTFPVYSAQYASPKIFESSSIPATFIVSKSGKLVLKEMGSADWATDDVFEIIDNLLSE